MAKGSVSLRAEIGPFKTAMNEAKAATKTLDAELKLAQAQFKATGDAEQYLDTRTKVLAQQITQQQKAADNARRALEQMRSSGVEPTDAAYQNMERSMYDAEREMVRLRQEADKTGDELTETGMAASKMSGVMNALKGMTPFASVTAGFAAVRSIINSAIDRVKELQQRLYESAQWADDINTKSARYGLSTEQLQQWEVAAKAVDTDVDTILKARDKLMNKARNEEVLFLSDGMTQYAVALKDAEGQTRDSMEVFWDFIDALGELQNATEKDQIAQEYFGKSFRDIETLIQKGRGEWEKYAKEASAVSQEGVDALNKVQDAKDRYEHELEVLQKNADARRAEQAEEWLNRKADYLHYANTGEVEGYMRSDIEAGISGLQSYKNWFGKTFPWLAELLGKDAETEQIAENAGKTAVDAFAAGADANAEAAANAGAAMAAAIVNAFASVTPSAGGNVTNNTTNQNFGNTFVFDASLSPDLNAAVAEAHRRANAGYGS